MASPTEMIWIFLILVTVHSFDDFDTLNGTDALNTTEEYDNTASEEELMHYSEMMVVQKNLSDEIFCNYDKELAPIIDTNGALDNIKWPLYFLFQRLKLMEVDEPNEQITIVTEISQMWFDPRLKWEKEKHQNISSLYMRLEKVWSPPFTVFTASEVVEHRDQNYRMVHLEHTGMLKAHIPMKIKINCKLNLENFPFDIQFCEIRTGIPSLKSHLYSVFLFVSGNLRFSCILGNSAWDVVAIEEGSQLVKSRDLNFDNTSMAVVKLALKRNPVYYMYMIVLPTFIINALSTAGVFLKNTDKIDRLTIGLTHIMTMTFILGIIADKLPKTEHVPLLGKYIIFSLATMIASLVISTYLKKISSALAEKLAETRSIAGQKLRRFIGSPLRVIFITIFQTANVVAAVYILAQWIYFENDYGYHTCKSPKRTMKIEPENIVLFSEFQKKQVTAKTKRLARTRFPVGGPKITTVQRRQSKHRYKVVQKDLL